MRSITTALLLLATARSNPTEEYEIPAGKTFEAAATYEPTASEESTPTHSERVGRLPECEAALIFPCDVQKIYLEEFVDDSEEQLTLEGLEQMNKAIEEIYSDPKEQDEIFNALDMLVNQKPEEVLAFGLNVLNGDVELADESLMYAVNGEAIWDKEVKHEDTMTEEPVVTEEIIIVTADEKATENTASEEPVVTEEIVIATADEAGVEMTVAPVEHEQKQSFAPKPETVAPKATASIPSYTVHPTYTQGSYPTYPTYTQGQIPPARTYKPYVSNVPATYAPIPRATYAPVYPATYAPMPQKYKQTPKKIIGTPSQRHVAPTMTAKTATRSAYIPTHVPSKKHPNGSRKGHQSTQFGKRGHHVANHVAGTQKTHIHKTHSPVGTFQATIPSQTKVVPTNSGFHTTAPLADANIYGPRYTVAPTDYTHQTYPSATPLPAPVYPEAGAALPAYNTANGNSQKTIAGTGN